jgi:cytochrome c551/c552
MRYFATLDSIRSSKIPTRNFLEDNHSLDMICMRQSARRVLRIAVSLATCACHAQEQPPSFLEKDTPFLRSGLVIAETKNRNRVRRGVIWHLGHDYWACFDPDLLRWAAIWQAEPGKPPLSYDTMASISYPNEKAKAERPPRLWGKILQQTPEALGAVSGNSEAKDPRTHFLMDGKTAVGPLPASLGQWQGISLRGKSTVLLYAVAGTNVEEVCSATAEGQLQRSLRIAAHVAPLRFLLGGAFSVKGNGAIVDGPWLKVAPSKQSQEITLVSGTETSPIPVPMPETAATRPLFSEVLKVPQSLAKTSHPFTIRDFPLPRSLRAIRPVDIAFLASGDAILSTLDGDIWKISDIEGKEISWRRVATGLYEPMAVSIDAQQRIFVLGRDQITELIDRNGDHQIDDFRCVSDAFFQTLHTRDFSTSMCIEKDGSFLIGKGGIDKEGSKEFVEHSTHRGSILRISADGQRIESIAQGLRMPFVGLRSDGAIFASDQQGNEIPSTPIHRILAGKLHYGFSPTNFDHKPLITEPLFYYPYQSNRSAAGFVTTGARAFPDLGESFLQVSWNGRLFPLLTPNQGQSFSWMLPLQLDFPSLKGATHPTSGRLYVTGLGISGYKPTTPRVMGLASVEQSLPFATPISFDVQSNAAIVTFHRALKAEESIAPQTLRLFDIKRTKNYGSGHFLWDQKPGEHHWEAESFALSADRRSLRIHYPLLRRSDVMDLPLRFTSGAHSFVMNLYTRPHHLPVASAKEMKEISHKQVAPLIAGNPDRGKVIFNQYACNGCHSLTDEKLTGPPLQSVATRWKAKDLRESILEPATKIAAGYPPSMPSFKGVIPAQDLEHLIAYLLTLKN